MKPKLSINPLGLEYAKWDHINNMHLLETNSTMI